jgi:hypothetical protein
MSEKYLRGWISFSSHTAMRQSLIGQPLMPMEPLEHFLPGIIYDNKFLAF